MKKLIIIAVIILLKPIFASDMLWYWDNDGATKGLLADQGCQCYFSINFPQKVIPRTKTYFTMHGESSQIVTLKPSKFLNANQISKSPQTILLKHLEYEFNYLKSVVGKDKLIVMTTEWDDKSNSFIWVLERTSKNIKSYLVSSSVVTSGCIFYLTTVVQNKSNITKVSLSQKSALKTLKTHRPRSEKDAKELIHEFSKS